MIDRYTGIQYPPVANGPTSALWYIIIFYNIWVITFLNAVGARYRDAYFHGQTPALALTLYERPTSRPVRRHTWPVINH